MIRMTSTALGVASAADGLSCYVCDAAVVGRYYTLASCKTQATKQKLVEKLGQMVGDQYTVVISEDDVICRSCNTMMNTLDRLEKEMSSIRSVILRFLEKKYELEEGELANSKVVLPPPPNPTTATSASKKNEKPLQTFHECKRQSVESKGVEGAAKMSNMWMQCDRCQYTTPYSSFMINHIHNHSQLAPSQLQVPQAPTVLNNKEEIERPNGKAVAAESTQQDEEFIGKTNDEGGGAPVAQEEDGETTLAMTNGDNTELPDNHDFGVMVNGDAEDTYLDGEDDGVGALEMDMGEEGLCMVDENGMVKKNGDNSKASEIKLMVKYGSEHRLTFIFDNSTWAEYWQLRSVVYESKPGASESSSIILKSSQDIIAPVTNSYHIGSKVSFYNRTMNASLGFDNMQVQPFFVNLGSKKFAAAIDAVEFFTPAIWSGLFVTFLLGLIFTWGLSMIMDICTMDQFDDPKGKTITVTATD